VRTLAGLLCVAMLAALAPAIDAASATGNEKLVEGLVYEGWCKKPGVEGCPAKPFPSCPPDIACNTNYKPFTTEGTIVNVRRRGSSAVIATVASFGGYFQTQLAPGRYAMRAITPPETCTNGQTERVTVPRDGRGPLYVPVGVYSYGNLTKEGTCAVYPHP
jgi:hypothetical protein